MINNKPDTSPLYPIFLKLHQLRVLLVGGGNVGLEKLGSLLGNSPDAAITIVAPIVKEEIKTLISEHPNCVIVERAFEETDLNEKELVICATDDKQLHQQIKQLANQRKLLVNVADTPELCDFYLGSIIQKGNLKIAISTNGKSPTVAKRLKEIINQLIPDDINDLLNNIEKIRQGLDGSFEDKIKQLNELTRVLVEKKEDREL
jgi:hypothetical protein